jgi:hypothetical protein
MVHTRFPPPPIRCDHRCMFAIVAVFSAILLVALVVLVMVMAGEDQQREAVKLREERRRARS